ncbi:hypothetical protein TcCL_ESM08860 [Trypanosoma cruzi]|nr:hypothetical protein TcCL_ESM08860 [Trypanosoma cruzi]
MIVWSRRVSTSVLFCGVFNGPFSATFVTPSRWKGDYGFNVFHNSNPQHGGSYARHERRMREDEVADFLRSVKGWVPADEAVTASPAVEGSSEAAEEEKGPTPMTVFTGEEAIKREFVFPTFHDAYLFMGRVWAFCYGSDKYPHVTWDGTHITVYLYSPSFRGISKREARLAAFLNDQYNMFRKSKRQQEQLLSVAVKQTRMEELMGGVVAEKLKQREEERRKPLAEVTESRAIKWESLLDENSSGKKEKKS